jgi:hypothetical protein
MTDRTAPAWGIQIGHYVRFEFVSAPARDHPDIAPLAARAKNETAFLTEYNYRYTILPMKQQRGNGGNRMRSHQIRFPDTLWERFKAKAGLTPASAIIRRLVEMWLDGKIKLD